MSTDTATRPRAKNPTLDDVLDKHWTGGDLVIVDDLPPDPATLSSSAQFAAQVNAAAPRWVMLPVPPGRLHAVKRHVTALRRRGLEATMRPHPDSSTAWAVWARAKQPASPAATAGQGDGSDAGR